MKKKEELEKLFTLKAKSLNSPTTANYDFDKEMDIVQEDLEFLLSRKYSNLNKEEQEYVSNIQRIFYDYLFNPNLSLSIISSKNFNDDFLKKLFASSKNLLPLVINKYNEIKTRINYLAEQDITTLSKKDQNMLFAYFSGQLDRTVNNKEELNEKALSQIDKAVTELVSNNDTTIPSGKNLIIKFAIYEKCKRKNIPFLPVHFASEEFITRKHSKKTGGYYSQQEITINEEALATITPTNNFLIKEYQTLSTTPPLITWLLVANHETEHYFQDYQLSSNNLDRNSFSYAVNSILQNELHDYKKNYHFREIENLANRQGFYDTIDFLYFHNFNNIDALNKLSTTWLQTYAKNSHSYQKTPNNERQIIEDYNIGNLITIIGKNPTYLKKYKILQNFFNPNGQLKDLDTLVEDYCSIKSLSFAVHESPNKKRELEPYHQVFTYLFSNNPSIDYNYVDRAKYSEVLADLAVSDLIKLQYIFDYDSKDRLPTAFPIIVEKISNRTLANYERLQRLNADPMYFKSINACATETKKVHETAKLMYPEKFSSPVDGTISTLTRTLGVDDSVKGRDPTGRKSAINI